MTQPLNLQSIIMTLQDFWARQGCLIWQPYYTQVGAGTLNPATSLRVLGPEPWNVAYVEPSVRPDDGRYGENPNRMQLHYQFQVILKPDPGNPQELYLKSLEALGADPRRHDIRFVEDNWESPALGAWGLGWEVWLDGQEITQFTYFQQAGGMALDPVSVELTYGLERIAIALQQVGSFRDIQWSPARTDGDVNLQAEQEHSKYYFEVADVERLRQMYDLYEAEASACLDRGLVLPAHDYILKCSHTFNVLDTRGAVGFTERQALFRRMRDLSRRVAEAYVEGRQKLEFPWLEEQLEEQLDENAGKKGQGELNGYYRRGGSVKTPAVLGASPAPLLFEIGVEELPAGDLEAALEQLRVRLPEVLDGFRLEHGAIQVMGTPRRLVMHVADLAPGQPDLEQVVKGPPANRAFGPGGEPTPAAEGFARSKGVALADLQVREIDGGSYVTAVVRQTGRSAVDVLAEALPGLIASIRFDKSMRWNHSNVAFSRPIRWLLALFGAGDAAQVIPFVYAGLSSGDRTRGLRFHQPEEKAVHSPQEYFDFLLSQGILLDSEGRQASVRRQVSDQRSRVASADPDDPALLAEVTNLVEAPTALMGSFDADHLHLPREVLISVMKKHQRYFPVFTAGGEALQPYFIAIRNGDEQHLETVIDGNEHVIRARFADANFFVREDLKKSLPDYLSRLDTLTFQAKLGSMLDKTHRVTQTAVELGQALGLDAAELSITRRAAELCKADLATHMVVEMTSLQGQMGRYYALRAGEQQAVADAIFEHYLPRFAGDASPSTRPGLVVGLADRLDSLVGLFAADMAPSGNKDPFALRRAALGLVQNLLAWDLDFDLLQAIAVTAAHIRLLPSSLLVTAAHQASVAEFIIERLRNVLLEQGYRYDAVDAALAAQGSNPARVARAVKALEGWVARPDWHTILPAYARCVRITRDVKERFNVNPAVFAVPAEAELFQALGEVDAVSRRLGSVDDFLTAFLPLIPPINRFFDDVLVMAEDIRLRNNRLGLLQRIVALADGVADFSKLEGF